jgi:predicted nuclease of predicted toxin-antitoxin system
VKFKLDENLSPSMAQPIAEAGHDVTSVSGQGLSGCTDQSLYELCPAERRILVTLDLDFANPLRFPPEVGAGIIVLRPTRPLLSLLASMLTKLPTALEADGVEGRLWIVEPTRIRVHEPQEGPPEP